MLKIFWYFKDPMRPDEHDRKMKMEEYFEEWIKKYKEAQEDINKAKPFEAGGQYDLERGMLNSF